MTGDLQLVPRDRPQAVQQQGLHLDPAQAEQIRGGHLEVSWDWWRPGHVTTLPSLIGPGQGGHLDMEQWTGGGGGDGEMTLTSDPGLSSSQVFQIK